jgi:hypothetical protein
MLARQFSRTRNLVIAILAFLGSWTTFTHLHTSHWHGITALWVSRNTSTRSAQSCIFFSWILGFAAAVFLLLRISEASWSWGSYEWVGFSYEMLLIARSSFRQGTPPRKITRPYNPTTINDEMGMAFFAHSKNKNKYKYFYASISLEFFLFGLLHVSCCDIEQPHTHSTQSAWLLIWYSSETILLSIRSRIRLTEFSWRFSFENGHRILTSDFYLYVVMHLLIQGWYVSRYSKWHSETRASAYM